jgi:hypothetical protein
MTGNSYQAMFKRRRISKNYKFTSKSIRFTTKDIILYAFLQGTPAEEIRT